MITWLATIEEEKTYANYINATNRYSLLTVKKIPTKIIVKSCRFFGYKLLGENYRMLNNIIGENIRAIRKKNKMTQDQLAHKLCIQRQTLSNYELGMRTPDVYTLTMVADIFDISLDVLVGRNES